MIIDKIENLKNYASVNPLFPKVVEFIAQHDLNALEPGKHEIVGKDLFVNIQMAKGRAPEEAVIETHDKMIDIQIPLDYSETYGTPSATLCLLLSTMPRRISPRFPIWPPTAMSRAIRA